jgi:pimeloyl-ACP methyl ester carboxylesterase
MIKGTYKFGSLLLASLALSIIPASNASATTCKTPESQTVIATRAGGKIAVRVIGSGRPVLMIPSLGRGDTDFDDVASRMARKGWMAILPDPRGIGGSTGPKPASLFDLAQDAATVIETLCDGPVDVVGHAFGNRVARALATAHPARVNRVVLLAGGGEVTPSPEIVAALEGSFAQGIKPDELRLRDLQLAFFAAGNDASLWLTGWYPATARQQMAAAQATKTALWWRAGTAPLMLVQATEDPIAPAGNAEALRRDVGERLALVQLRHASHAILPEQPKAVAMLLSSYLGGLSDERKLQALTDRSVRKPSKLKKKKSISD